MSIDKLAELTWEEVRDLDHERTVAILPIGAIEAHGPHLPLDTDVHISVAMAEAGAKRLDKAGLLPIVLPCLPYASAGFAAEFPGTISVPPESVTQIVLGTARSLTTHGFSILAVVSAHLDPTHLESIHSAVRLAREEGLLRLLFPDITQKPWASRMSEEFKSGACHAGQYETSVVMAARPKLVREEKRRVLAPNLHSLSKAIRAGLESFREAKGPMAYFGTPQAASAEEGRATIDTLGEILCEAVMAARAGDTIQ